MSLVLDNIIRFIYLSYCSVIFRLTGLSFVFVFFFNFPNRNTRRSGRFIRVFFFQNSNNHIEKKRNPEAQFRLSPRPASIYHLRSLTCSHPSSAVICSAGICHARNWPPGVFEKGTRKNMEAGTHARRRFQARAEGGAST